MLHFPGNANLVYTIIRKRNVFHQMANLPTEHAAIAKALTKRGKKMQTPAQADPSGRGVEPSMEGSMPAQEAEPGTLKVSLAATPGLFHPHVMLLRDISLLFPHGARNGYG